MVDDSCSSFVLLIDLVACFVLVYAHTFFNFGLFSLLVLNPLLLYLCNSHTFVKIYFGTSK